MLHAAERTAKNHDPSAVKDKLLSSIIVELELEEEEEEEEMTGGEGNGGRVVERWREIHGCDDWAGLLDRKMIQDINYGRSYNLY